MAFLTSQEERDYQKRLWTGKKQKLHTIQERKEHRENGVGFGEHYVTDALTSLGYYTGYLDDQEYASYLEHNNQIYHDLDNPVDILPTSYNYDDSQNHNQEMHSYNGNPVDPITGAFHNETGHRSNGHLGPGVNTDSRQPGRNAFTYNTNDSNRINKKLFVEGKERELYNDRMWGPFDYYYSDGVLEHNSNEPKYQRVFVHSKNGMPHYNPNLNSSSKNFDPTEGDVNPNGSRHNPLVEALIVRNQKKFEAHAKARDAKKKTNSKTQESMYNQFLQPKISNQTMKRYSMRRPSEAKANNKKAHIDNGNNKNKNGKKTGNKMAKATKAAAKAVASAVKRAVKPKSRPATAPRNVTNVTNIVKQPSYHRKITHSSHNEPARIYSNGKDSLIIDKVEYLGELMSTSDSFSTANAGTFSYNPGSIGTYLKKQSQMWTSYRVKKLDLHFIPLSASNINNGGALAAQTGSVLVCVQCNVDAARPTDSISLMNTATGKQYSPWKQWSISCPKNNMYGQFVIRNGDARISAKNMADYCNFTVATSSNVNNTTVLGVLQLHTVVEFIGGKITPSSDPVGFAFNSDGTMSSTFPVPTSGNKIANSQIKGNVTFDINYPDNGTFDITMYNINKGYYTCTVGYYGLVAAGAGLNHSINLNNLKDSAGNSVTSYAYSSITSFFTYSPNLSNPVDTSYRLNFYFANAKNDGILKMSFSQNGTGTPFALPGVTNGSLYYVFESLPSSNIYALYDPLEEKFKQLEEEFESKLQKFQTRLIHVEEEDKENEEYDENLIEKLDESNAENEKLISEKEMLINLLSKMQSGSITELDKKVIKNFTK